LNALIFQLGMLYSKGRRFAQKEEIARCSRVMLEKVESEEEEKVIRELIVLQAPVSKAKLNARHS
jgi:hypothetical protein